MGKDADGYVRVKLDIDTDDEKKLNSSLDDIQENAESAKRKLDALKDAGVDESAPAYREAAEELEKYNKQLEKYLKAKKEAKSVQEPAKEITAEQPDTGVAEAKEPAKVKEGNFDSISDQVEDYETRLKMLRNKGFGPGDEHFDELYIAWKNASDAEKEYLAGLDKLTDKGIEREAEKARKEEEAQKKAAQALEEKNRREQEASQRAAEAQKKREEAEERQQEAAARKQEEINRKQEEAARKEAEQAAEYERLNKMRADAKVRDKDLVKLLEEQEKITARMSGLKKAGVGEGYEEYDNLSVRLKEVNDSIKGCRDGFKKADESGKKTLSSVTKVATGGKKAFSDVNKSAKKSSGVFGTIASRFKGLALSLLIFNQISKGFNALVSAAKEGFKNIASYSKEYNGVMSAYKSSLAELKNNLAAAFEPIVDKVIPYLTMMVNGLNTAIEAISKFIAYMSGKSTYTRAKKQLIDYKETVDETNKSLADFDDLTVLDDSSSGGEQTGANAFETVDIGEVPEAFKQFKEIYESYIKPALNGIKEAIEWIGGKAGTLLKKVFGDIAESAAGLWNSIANLIEKARPYFSTMVENAKRLFTVLFNALYAIWDTIGRPIFDFIVQILRETIDFFADHVGEMSDAFGDFVDGVEDSWSNYLLPVLTGIKNFLEGTLLPVFNAVFRDGVLPAVSDVFDAICDLISGTLKPAFDGICEFLNGVFSGDFQMAMNGLKNIVRAVMNGIIIIVESGINLIINGINALIGVWNNVASKLHVPTIDLVGKVSLAKLEDDGSWNSFKVGNNSRGYDAGTGRTYGGHTVSGSTGESVFYGTKSRYGSSELTSWNNNNNLSNNVKSGSAFGANENSSYTFVAEIDGKTIFREVVNQDKLRKNRTGYSAFAD